MYSGIPKVSTKNLKVLKDAEVPLGLRSVPLCCYYVLILHVLSYGNIATTSVLVYLPLGRYAFTSKSTYDVRLVAAAQHALWQARLPRC